MNIDYKLDKMTSQCLFGIILSTLHLTYNRINDIPKFLQHLILVDQCLYFADFWPDSRTIIFIMCNDASNETK